MKGGKEIPKLPTAHDLRPSPDGILEALSSDGKKIIQILELNGDKRPEWRRIWMQTAELALDHDAQLFARLTAWPDNPPNLHSENPPGGNTR